MARFKGKVIDYVIAGDAIICTACGVEMQETAAEWRSHVQDCPGYTRDPLLYEVGLAELALSSKQAVSRAGRWGVE